MVVKFIYPALLKRIETALSEHAKWSLLVGSTPNFRHS